MKKNKNIIKRIGCIIGAFMVALVSICSIIPTKKQKVDYSSADVIETLYTGNYMPYSVNLNRNNTYLGSSSLMSNPIVRLSFSNVGFQFNLKLTVNDVANNLTSNIFNSDFNTYNLTTEWTNHTIKIVGGSSGSSIWYVSCQMKCSSVAFQTQNLTMVEIYSGHDTNIIYYDSNNNTFTFCFVLLDVDSSSPLRIMYPGSSDRISFNISNLNNTEYSFGYSQGTQAGYNSGYNEGYDTGKADGQSIGYNTGYSVGKADGLALSNDYTFMSLFSAIFDAPIQALTGLFNFEILGVNLYNFLTGLFTLAVIIMIIRLVL